MKDLLKANSVIEEIEGSFELICSGLKSINDTDLFWKSNSVPIHLLSFGFERFFKAIILMYVNVENGDYPALRPKKKFFRNKNKNGHQITDFFDEIIDAMETQKYFQEIPLIKNGFTELKNCSKFYYFLNIMNSYSQYNRFFYLDMITTDNLSEYFEDENNPYKKFQRSLFNYFEREETLDIPYSLEEKQNALRTFTYLLFNHLRTLNFNFSHGFDGKFRAYSHGFQIFTNNTNEYLYDKLII